MKKKTALFALSLLITTSASAQHTLITGTLKDSVKNETEPYATVRVFRPSNRQKPVAMSLTDAEGRIKQALDGKGTFILTFSSVGKKPVMREVTLNGQSMLALGDVCTAEDATALKNVEVVAQRPIVKMEPDKMTYNVQEDGDSKSMTLLDMLRKVPMVTVDGQDNISVNGSASFKVYVDGKPNPMFQANASQIFKSLPASMVKNIEVITNPGAKYDAEGTGGVLNIVLNHAGGQGTESLNGYNGNVSLGAGNRGYSGSAFVSGQQGKFSYSANATHNLNRNRNIRISIDRTQTAPGGNSQMHYEQRSDNKTPFNMGNMSLGYALDSMSTLNANIGITQYRTSTDGLPRTSLSGGSYGSGFTYSAQRADKYHNFGFNGSMDYQRFFNREHTRSLTASYLFTVNPSRSESESRYDAPSGITGLNLTDRYSDAHLRSTEHTVQIDYATPVAKGHSLDVGAKFISHRNTSDSRFYNIAGNAKNYDEANSTDYENTQRILAGYAEYRAALGKLGTKAGLRYEHTWENIDFRKGAGSDFSKHYGNLVPSATLSYNLAPTTNLGLNYNMRILRPGVTYLNPYRDNSNPTNVSYGNPALDVEKSHYISLVFNYYSPKLMVNATLGQNLCNNQIATYSFMEDNRLHTTYGNVVKNRWTSFNTFMRWMAGKNTTLMLNAALDYGDMRSSTLNRRNHGWQTMGYASLQQTLPWLLKWSLGVYANSRHYDLQGYQSGNSLLFTSLNKDLCKDRLTLSLLYVVPLTGKYRVNSYSHGADFEQHTKILVPIQMVRLTATWKFGNTQKQFRQRQSRINNDFGERKSESQQLNNIGSGTGIGM